jgi:gamma-glutamyl:cysteine ligase YbdK (ATP-grasp superfamily)
MGDEISRDHFDQRDFDLFDQRLVEETGFVRSLFEQAAFDNQSRVLGYELELCLVDKEGHPSRVNQKVLDGCANPLLTMELAKFNLEINGNPFKVDKNVLSNMDSDLTDLYQQVRQTAQGLDAHTVLFGVLPSLHRQHLNCDNYMSEQHRYNQLSHQLIEMRGRPIQLELQGEDHLSIEKNDVMLEALGTSLQIHLQVPFDEAADTYNAALWASMLVLGATPNSPLVLGKSCWQESRIAIFKQAVDTRNPKEVRDGIVPRVHFGKAYIDSMLELFEDNFYYSPILPEVTDSPIEALHHFNLHNGTIWRWVRPILGQSPEGDYHLRLELRVVPSGPTLVDTMANTAFYMGLTEGLKRCGENLRAVEFTRLESDFYRAAQFGMQAQVHWIDGKQGLLKDVILSHALPLALQGLEQMGIDNPHAWLDIIKARILNQQTGADWILQHWTKFSDTTSLVQTYQRHASQNTPVHSWPKP